MKKQHFLRILALMLLCVLLTGCSSAVNDTIAAIDAIPTAENKTTAVRAAEELYDKLSDKQKEQVTNIGILLVAQTEAAISDIGYVSEFSMMSTLSKADTINKAGRLYASLSDEQKAQVTNAEKLTEAQTILTSAQKAERDAQTFAEKLFVRFAKCFKHPESISLQHVWYSTTTGTLHDFTFQFDVKNGVGIVENVYYGTKISFTELDDESLNKWVSGFMVLGDGSYFAEGETGAMDAAAKGYGIELDAEAIQTYFLRNR